MAKATAQIRKGTLAHAVIAILAWLGSSSVFAGSPVQIAARPPEPAPAPPQTALTQPATSGRAGNIGAFNAEATAKMADGTTHKLKMGEEVVVNERIVTGPNGQVFVWFADGSSLTVGPNSDVEIDTFLFDPSNGAGKIALSSGRGVLRYIGGKISKHQDSVTLKTPVGAVGVRGGVFLIALGPNGNTISTR
jgi:hypothetical protein